VQRNGVRPGHEPGVSRGRVLGTRCQSRRGRIRVAPRPCWCLDGQSIPESMVSQRRPRSPSRWVEGRMLRRGIARPITRGGRHPSFVCRAYDASHVADHGLSTRPRERGAVRLANSGVPPEYAWSRGARPNHRFRNRVANVSGNTDVSISTSCCLLARTPRDARRPVLERRACGRIASIPKAEAARL